MLLRTDYSGNYAGVLDASLTPGHTCVVCGSTPTQDPDASFHRLPSDPARRASWLDAFGLEETTQGPVTSVLLLPPARGNFQAPTE